MTTEYIYDLPNTAAVAAHEDADDGAEKRVLIIQDRRCNPESRIIFAMSPLQARQLARKLTKYANFLDPPKARRRG